MKNDFLDSRLAFMKNTNLGGNFTEHIYRKKAPTLLFSQTFLLLQFSHLTFWKIGLFRFCLKRRTEDWYHAHTYLLVTAASYLTLVSKNNWKWENSYSSLTLFKVTKEAYWQVTTIIIIITEHLTKWISAIETWGVLACFCRNWMCM